MKLRKAHIWWIAAICCLSIVIGGLWFINDRLAFGNATPLHRAILNRDFQRAHDLILGGADVRARMRAELFPTTWGATPLHLAARRNSSELILDLIQAGADPNAPDDLGFTPLHAAVLDRHEKAAMTLLRSGASVRTPPLTGRARYAFDNCGQPLSSALSECSISMVQALLDAGANPSSDIGENAMAYARSPDLLSKFQLLVKLGCPVRVSDRFNTPLHIASISNDTSAIEFLLDQVADIEATTPDTTMTPLLAAASSRAHGAVKMLIERGANISTTTMDGKHYTDFPN